MGFIPIASCSSCSSCSATLQATGPSRGFTQLNGSGTQILNCDDCASILELPFNFAFGSRNISKVSVFSNGVIELGLGGSSAASYIAPVPIPSSQPLPLAHIAIAQTDLAPNESVCTHHRRHRRFIYYLLNQPPLLSTSMFQHLKFVGRHLLLLRRGILYHQLRKCAIQEFEQFGLAPLHAQCTSRAV